MWLGREGSTRLLRPCGTDLHPLWTSYLFESSFEDVYPTTGDLSYFYTDKLTLGLSMEAITNVNVFLFVIRLITVDVVEWSRALGVRLRKWCCSVSMVWVQIYPLMYTNNVHN
jgi:hypothetical protein